MSGGSSSNPLPGDFPKTPKPEKPPRTPSRGRSRAVTRSQTASKVTTRNPSPEDDPEPSEPSRSPSPIPQPKSAKMSESRKIPTLDVKLSGPSTYPEWVISIENYLSIISIGEYEVWDVITGEYAEPTTVKSEKSSTSIAEQAKKENKAWKNANAVALLTIRKNCEENVRQRIGSMGSAKAAFDELKRAYEGKTTTEFGALLDSFTSISYADRKSTVDDHIVEYERIWNSFTGIISRVNLTTDDGFGEGLKAFAKSDRAKTEFLLRSFPPFYANTIENIKSKDPAYDDAVRRLREYVPARQRNKTRKGETADNPVVLKTDKGSKKDNGKRCDYCIKKGWKGLNHTESECYTKKREDKKQGKSKKTKGEDSDNESENGGTICYVKVRSANYKEPANHFEYDTGTTHNTTNRIDLLENIQEISMTVEAHDKSVSTCNKKGTLVFEHNGKTHRLENTLYNPTYSNLISGQRQGKYTLECEGQDAKLLSKGEVIYKMKVDGKGAMWIKVEKTARIQNVNNQKEALELHERYGHISYDTLKSLPECSKFDTKPRCEACEKGKATKPAARNHNKKGTQIRTSRPLERLHADLVGPIKPTTPSTQYKYLLTVTDDYSRYVVTTRLKAKSGTTDALINTVNALEKATTHQVSQIQADWGGEFRNKELANELKQRGITLKETVPGHSETNAVAERTNRTILTMSRTAIIASGLPKSLWDKASAWAAYTKNRMPHKTHQKVPAEVLLDRNPEKARSNLRPFGQRVNCFDYDVKDKLTTRSWEGRIVGYTLTHGIYQVMTSSGSFKLAKDPVPIPNQRAKESEAEDSDENSAPEAVETILEEALQVNPDEKKIKTPIPTVMPEPPPAPRKKRRTAAEWEEKVASRFSTREKKPTEKAQTHAVGTDPDHPTDEQARNSLQAAEWAKARRKERAQLEKYGVFTKVNK